jgi:hypothetical protein
MGMPRSLRRRDLGGSAWPQGIHKPVGHPPTRALLLGTLLCSTHQNSRALYGTGLVGYTILIVSRNPALSYFAIYLAAAWVFKKYLLFSWSLTKLPAVVCIPQSVRSRTNYLYAPRV